MTLGRKARITLGCTIALAALAAAPQAANAASVAQVFGGTLTIAGDNTANHLTVSFDGAFFNIAEGNTTINAVFPCTQNGPNAAQCPLDPTGANQRRIHYIDSFLAAGDDVFINNTTFGTQRQDFFGGTYGHNGQAGNDTILGGSGSEYIWGGADTGTAGGNDILDGGGGDDHLGDGSIIDAFSNNFDADPSGNDTLVGGPGNDTAHYEGRGNGDNLRVTLDRLANDGDTALGEQDNVQTENVITGRGHDFIVGDTTANRLNGGPGDDQIRGGPGGDKLFGEEGLDQLFGDAGRNTLHGGDDNDVLRTSFNKAKDRLECDAGDADQALADARDGVSEDCERSGAELVSESAKVSGESGGVSPRVTCSEEETGGCKGTVRLKSNGELLGKESYSIAAGKTAKVKVTLNDRGRQAVGDTDENSLTVAVEISTREPNGKTLRGGKLELRG